jgi:hypothetical protein
VRYERILQGTIIITSLWAGSVFGSNQLQFTKVNTLPQGSIQLHWASNPNEVYEIDYATQLQDQSQGGTVWLPLYTDYPSHGTNTIVTDDGNYDLAPEIPHPRFTPYRFYRIVMTGTNTSPTNPQVTVTSPANNSTVSGDITVSVSSSSSEILSEVHLYIDGEEQWMSNDGTNFFINTCEWPNGPHTIFATAVSESGIQGFPYNYPITFGRAVSPYVNVTFNNLITMLDISQFFFEPSLGQTQQVTATFAAPANWTLQIQNSSSNTVRYVTGNTGTGASMAFNWDGTGTNGVTLPDGVYSYLLSTQTNGQALVVGGGGTTNTNPPPPPGGSRMATVSAEDGTTTTVDWYPMTVQEATAAGMDVYYMQPPPFPPVRVNGQWVPWEDVYGTESLIARPALSPSDTTLQASLMAQAQYSGPSSQSTRGPKRKPRVGVKNKSGNFGVCYKTYPLGFFLQQPRNGQIPPLQPFTGVDGGSPNNGYIPWSSLPVNKTEVKGFVQGMTLGGFKEKFVKADEQWGPNDIKKASLGGSSIFNTCNFGVLSTHGCRGTNPEIDGVKYTYFALFDQANGGSYLRLSDMDFGSTGTDGLRWMTLLVCNTLYPANVTSMANNSRLPDNANLHLLLGASSFMYGTPYLGILYASNMVFDVAIKTSFENAGRAAYAKAYASGAAAQATMTNSATFRTMGYNSCINDTLRVYNDPDPNTSFQIIDTPVYTKP